MWENHSSNLFQWTVDTTFISPYQSEFEPGDSSVNQLFSITQEIYKSLDGGFKVRIAFLDISKTRFKVWKRSLFQVVEKQHVWKPVITFS